MQSPRKSGALLLLGALMIFVGINNQLLPPVWFWAALALSPVGIVLFMKGNREATEKLESRARRNLSPTIRSVAADGFADRQARGIMDRGIAALDPGPRQTAQPLRESGQPRGSGSPNEILLCDIDDSSAAQSAGDLEITTDVSFPIEVQSDRALSDELDKLGRLLQDGIIDEHEFATAKAKILR